MEVYFNASLEVLCYSGCNCCWVLTHECDMVPDWIGTFLKRAKKIGMTFGGKVAIGGMVTLLVKRKIQLAGLGYLKKNPVDPPHASELSYNVPQLQKVKLLHSVERDGHPTGYLWEFGRTGDENYIQLPLESG